MTETDKHVAACWEYLEVLGDWLMDRGLTVTYDRRAGVLNIKELSNILTSGFLGSFAYICGASPVVKLYQFYASGNYYYMQNSIKDTILYDPKIS